MLRRIEPIGQNLFAVNHGTDRLRDAENAFLVGIKTLVGETGHENHNSSGQAAVQNPHEASSSEL